MWTDDAPLETTFVGRPREVQFLTEAADDPSCRGVLVLGIAGVGKTSLLRFLARDLETAGRDVIFVSLRQYPNTEELYLHLSRLTHAHSGQSSFSPSPIHHDAHYADRLRLHGRAHTSDWARGLSDRENHIFLDSLDEFRDPARLINDLISILNTTANTLKFYISSRVISDVKYLTDSSIRILNLTPFSQAEARHYLDISFHKLGLHSGLPNTTIDALAAYSHGNPLFLTLFLRLASKVDLSRIVAEPHEGIEGIVGELISLIITDHYVAFEPNFKVTLDQLFYVMSGFAEYVTRIDFLTELLGTRVVNFILSRSSDLITLEEGRTSGTISFPHVIIKEHFRERFLTECPFDAHALAFGAEEAERDNKLGAGSVSPPILTEVVSGNKSIILGDRGSGKSALVQFLKSRTRGKTLQDISNGGDKTEFIIPNPEFVIVVKKYQLSNKAEQLTADLYKEIWLLYFAENLARYVWRTIGETASTRRLIRRFLLRQNAEFLRAAEVTRIGRTFVWLAEHLQAKVNLSLLGIPITFEASGKDLGRRVIDLSEVLNALNQVCNIEGKHINIVLDKLDEIHKYNRTEQEKVIQGLFLAEGYFANFTNMKVIILLRTDLYEIYNIEEKNKHVGRSVRLTWDINDLYRMMMARVSTNKQLGQLASILARESDDDILANRARLKLLFPERVDERPISECLEAHLSNARRQISPRQIVLLLLCLREAMLLTPKRGSALPMFEEHQLDAALDRVSQLSFDELIDDFRIGRTFLRNCRAGNIFKVSLEEARALADAADGDINEQLNRLEELGVLERAVGEGDGGKRESVLHVPLLYRRCWPTHETY
jgi:Cdc6-like AAA superfamily ATPase